LFFFEAPAVAKEDASALASEVEDILNTCAKAGIDFKEVRFEDNYVLVIDFGPAFGLSEIRIPLPGVTVDAGNGFIDFQCLKYGCIQEYGSPNPFNYNRRQMRKKTKGSFPWCEPNENDKAGKLLQRLSDLCKTDLCR
jgi:hypothetical protein